MKRDSRLRDLSSDHHHALALARRAIKAAAAKDSIVPETMWVEVQERFVKELEPHFEIEERLILPALQEAGHEALVKRTLNEHQAIKQCVSGKRENWRFRLRQFGDKLSAHVRFEERQLFTVAEDVLSNEVLAHIHHITSRRPFIKTF